MNCKICKLETENLTQNMCDECSLIYDTIIASRKLKESTQMLKQFLKRANIEMPEDNLYLLGFSNAPSKDLKERYITAILKKNSIDLKEEFL